MKKTPFLLAGVAASLLVSCKKETAAPPSPPILGKWAFEKRIFYDFENGQTMRVDTYARNTTDCERDDFTAYLQEGKGYFSKGQILCVGEQPTVDSFRYTLSPDNTQLTTTGKALGSNYERKVRLKTLTSALMIRVDTFTNFGNGNFSTAETYFKKLP